MSIIVKNLTHIYNEGMPFASKALDDVSFEIKDRDFVGLIGHTGSGKSTLIQHLNGLKAFTQNTITDFEKLEKELIEAKTNGYAIEKSEINDYTSCISIPLLKDSKAIASLSVSIPTFRFSDEKFELIKNILLEVRFKIETFFKENDIDADIFMFNDVE